MGRAREPRAEAYREAALERCDDAVALLESERYAGAIWVAGVALESLLRACHRRASGRLETGHNLRTLFRTSGFADHIAPKRADRIADAVSEVAEHWKHRYRYDPSGAVQRSTYTRTPAEFRRLAQRIVDAAHEAVHHGVSRWQSRR
jgi:HEPN domain-containing protein